MVKNTNKRFYSLDLLRIISMLMIITLHYCTFGYQIRIAGTLGHNTPILWLIYALCYGAVNLYVLISGYFLCDSEFKWKKALKLWIEIIFYSVVIFFIFYATGRYDFSSMRDFLKVFMPVLSNTYWFVSVYFVMYILSPFLNKFIKALSKKDYIKLLITLTVIMLICNNFIPGTNLIDTSRGYGIIWFIYLYLLAAYIKKYDFIKMKNIYYLLIFIGFSLITFFSRYFIINYLSSVELFKNQSIMLFTYNSFSVFIASLGLFMFFKNLKIKEILPNIISKISISTFGVYLIHDNFLVRNIIYKDILKVTYYGEKSLAIKSTAMICSILGVFVICTIIDLIRQVVFKKMDL